MARRIIIDEDAAAKPAAVLVPAESKRLDLQDSLLALGVLFLEAAAVILWWPAALILAGIFCLGFAFLIERSKSGLKTAAHGNSKS